MDHYILQSRSLAPWMSPWHKQSCWKRCSCLVHPQWVCWIESNDPIFKTDFFWPLVILVGRSANFQIFRAEKDLSQWLHPRIVRVTSKFSIASSQKKSMNQKELCEVSLKHGWKLHLDAKMPHRGFYSQKITNVVNQPNHSSGSVTFQPGRVSQKSSSHLIPRLVTSSLFCSSSSHWMSPPCIGRLAYRKPSLDSISIIYRFQ